MPPVEDRSAWVQELLRRAEAYGPDAAAALDYIRQHRIRVGVHAQPTGARWTVRRHLDLAPHFADGPADNPRAVALVIHEVRHLQQGPLTALSVYGEMDAWQLQFSFLKSTLGHYDEDASRAAVIEELMQQPLGWQRSVLEHVRELMRRYTGPKYRIDLLPLYPAPREIVFRLTGRQP